MSRSANGRRTSQRKNLMRHRKDVHLHMRIETFEKLVKMAHVGLDGRAEPLVSVIERLVTDADVSFHGIAFEDEKVYPS